MKYKVGDRVRIKSLDWYNENKDEFGEVRCKGCPFINSMTLYCNSILTIKDKTEDCYWVKENAFNWTDEMIEELVEEESEKKLSDESWRYKNIFDHSQYPQSFECPEGYIFKDENGNVINATKIVLEKKKKEYPKTYEECCKVMGVEGTWHVNSTEWEEYDKLTPYEKKLDYITSRLKQLIICRDAYWKIAGEEMGLGRSWEPNDSSGYCTYAILRHTGHISKSSPYANSKLLEFPTKEMRDAFYENFKKLINECKELL